MAIEYDRARPGYPPGVIRELRSVAELGREARVLDVGCGTGHSIAPLAGLGCRIVGIEPARNMASICRRRLRPFPNVEVREVAFESLTDTEPYDLVLCAGSFHWLEPATRLAALHDLLRPGGWLAAMTNSNPRAGSGFFALEREIYLGEVGPGAESLAEGPSRRRERRAARESAPTSRAGSARTAARRARRRVSGVRRRRR